MKICAARGNFFYFGNTVIVGCNKFVYSIFQTGSILTYFKCGISVIFCICTVKSKCYTIYSWNIRSNRIGCRRHCCTVNREYCILSEFLCFCVHFRGLKCAVIIPFTCCKAHYIGKVACTCFNINIWCAFLFWCNGKFSCCIIPVCVCLSFVITVNLRN